MIIKVEDHVAAYGAVAKHTRDVHRLDGRGGQRVLTAFVNQNIYDGVGLKPGDKLLDIGCGDGALLFLAGKQGVTNAQGLQGTEAEAARLRSLGLNVVQGFTDALPVADSSKNVVVCNSVLLLVPRERIPTSLREIARVAELEGRIWLGEIPRTLELADVPRHKTVTAMLWFLLRHRGLRTFLGMCRKLVRQSISGEPVILNTGKHIEFWSDPEDFVRMATSAGLTLIRCFPHRELDATGSAIDSYNRFDYLFMKA